MAIENFTTYTEVDTSGVLTVIASKITGVDVDRDIDAYVYKDFGADHFNALDVLSEIQISSASLNYALGGGPAFTVSVVDDYWGFGIRDILVTTYKGGAADYQIRLARGALAAYDTYACSADTTYYLRMERAADSDTVTLKIYSDADRTDLLDTLSIADYLTTTKYRYCYGFVNANSGHSGCDWDGFVQNLDLQEVALARSFGVIIG